MAGKAKKRVLRDFGHFILHMNIRRQWETRNHYYTTQILFIVPCTFVHLTLALFPSHPMFTLTCTRCVLCHCYLLTHSPSLSLSLSLPTYSGCLCTYSLIYSCSYSLLVICWLKWKFASFHSELSVIKSSPINNAVLFFFSSSSSPSWFCFPYLWLVCDWKRGHWQSTDTNTHTHTHTKLSPLSFYPPGYLNCSYWWNESVTKCHSRCYCTTDGISLSVSIYFTLFFFFFFFLSCCCLSSADALCILLFSIAGE